MVSPAVIAKVLSKVILVGTHSWEYGTVAQALLEWRNSTLSIWNEPFPNNTIPTLPWDEIPSVTYVKDFIRTDNTTLVDGDGVYRRSRRPRVGISALLIGKSSPPYYIAAIRQASHLLHDVPRWSNGAISHREAYPELWTDFIYMVPPFLAYYGVASDNITLVKQVAEQCKLYAEVLRTDKGAWVHIVSDHTQDAGLWSSGNGWAVAGMGRVLATLVKSGFREQTKAEQEILVEMIKEIVDGARKLDVDNSGLLRNYLDDESWFGEISGTALIAATGFRAAVLEPEVFGAGYTEWASKKLEEVDKRIDKETGTMSPAINPLDWHDKTPFTSGSPEGQSFVVLLHAAYRDWKGDA